QMADQVAGVGPAELLEHAFDSLGAVLRTVRPPRLGEPVRVEQQRLARRKREARAAERLVLHEADGKSGGRPGLQAAATPHQRRAMAPPPQPHPPPPLPPPPP